MNQGGKQKMNKKQKSDEKYNEIKKLKERVADYYDSVCAVCKKKKKVMQFHHLEYREGELTNKDFKNNDDYQLYILPIIDDRPEDFEYLCRSHHWKVTKATKSEETRKQLERLVEIVRETK